MTSVVNLTPALSSIASKTVQDLRDALARAGRNASGATAQSIEQIVKQEGTVTTLIIQANENILALEQGRGPTRSGGSGNSELRQRILEWIKAKPVRFQGINESSLAFLIARKIHREGYKGTPGLISEVISDKLLEEITSRMSEELTRSGIVYIERALGDNQIRTT